jgi:hypothetical protein
MEEYRKLINNGDIDKIARSREIELVFEMAARYGKLEIIRHFLDDSRISTACRYAAFTNACRHGQRDIAKYIYDKGEIAMTSTVLEVMMRRGHFEMLRDYSNYLEDASYYADLILTQLCSVEAVMILDSIGSNIVCRENLALAIRGKSLKIVEYFHKRGVSLDIQHLLIAQNVNAYDIVFYFSENGLEPTDFFRRYVNVCKKVKARRERHLANKVYYVLINRIYTPGTECANRLALASYNASMEGRLI